MSLLKCVEGDEKKTLARNKFSFEINPEKDRLYNICIWDKYRRNIKTKYPNVRERALDPLYFFLWVNAAMKTR